MRKREQAIKLRNMTSLYITRGTKVLLLYRIGSRVVPESYIGTAGGHFEPDELNDPETCVIRELTEELNINTSQLINFRLKYITLRLKNGEIRQNYHYFAYLDDTFDEEITSNEGNLQWFDWGELYDLDMPFSAKKVLIHYFEIGIFSSHMFTGTAVNGTMEFHKLMAF